MERTAASCPLMLPLSRCPPAYGDRDLGQVPSMLPSSIRTRLRPLAMDWKTWDCPVNPMASQAQTWRGTTAKVASERLPITANPTSSTHIGVGCEMNYSEVGCP